MSARGFSRIAFAEAVASASGCESSPAPDVVRYLSVYLERDLGATTMVVETDYTDRHYLEEYKAYYAGLLSPPPSRAVRLHFFDGELPVLDDDGKWGLDLDALLISDDAEPRLQAAYLGFVVVRPLSYAPIGRTVLHHMPESGVQRCFSPADVSQDVHLWGTRLQVQGLAFQQQDQAVGACATTALWSALCSVQRQNGRRPASPSSITESASKVFEDSGRRYPALDGLTPRQMFAAIDDHGFVPRVFSVSGDGAVQADAFFRLALQCYLRSGFPVLLHVQGDDDHAVCAVGFGTHNATVATATFAGGAKLQFLQCTRVYVHDDRLGPYARASLLAPGEAENPKKSSTAIRFEQRGEKEQWAAAFGAPAPLLHGIVPLYPKIRLTALELAEHAVEWTQLLRRATEDPLVVPYFALGGRYLSAFRASGGLPADRLVAFLSCVSLSRYVGVLRMTDTTGAPFLDVLIDATDLRRKNPFHGTLAVIPYSDGLTQMMRALNDTGMFPADVVIA